MTKEDAQPSPTASTEFHPALSINNIWNAIPLILDREKVHYSNWVELFETHLHAFNILDHIDPKIPRSLNISDII